MINIMRREILCHMDIRDIEIGDIFMEILEFEVYMAFCSQYAILFLLVLAARCFSTPILVRSQYMCALAWHHVNPDSTSMVRAPERV